MKAFWPNKISYLPTFLILCFFGSVRLTFGELSKADTEFFVSKIRPIFANNCYKCHSSEAPKLKGGLSLEFKETVLTGGDTGPAITPGDPEKSLLIKAVRYTDPDLQMPPKNKKLSGEQIALLEEWVKRGAPDSRLATTSPATAKKKSGKDH